MRLRSDPAAACEAAGSRFGNKADVTALLGAFCFFLSAIEYMLPKPLPFMRLGIANLPILLAVDLLPFPWFLTLAVVKVIGMSVISGSLFSFVALFSLAGTLTAALVMWAARKLGGKLVSQVGVSILGAMTSNAIQIFIARYVVFGQAAWLIAPVFLVMGLVTGLALGLFAERFASGSKWYACAAGLVASTEVAAPSDPASPEGPGAEPGEADPGEERLAARATSDAARAGKKRNSARDMRGAAARAERKRRFASLFSPWAAALAGAVVAMAFLFEQSLPVKAGFFLFFIVAAYLAGKRFSLVTALVVSTGIVLTNLLVPSGKVIARLGPLAITQFALTEGIMKALTFEGLMLLSKATIMQGLKLPGKLGGIVGSAFLYYDRIIEYKGKVRASTLSADADAMMIRVWEEESLAAGGAAKSENPAGPPPARAKTGNFILILAASAAAVALILL